MKTSGQLRLEQKVQFKGWQSFEQRDEETLHVKIKRAFTANEFSVPLTAINPKFSKLKRKPIKWFAAIFISGALAALWWLLCANALPDKMKAEPYAVAAVMFTAFFVVACYDYRVNSQNSVIFHNRFNGQPILVLWSDFPTKDQVDTFVSALADKAKVAGETWTRSRTKGVAEEIRQLKKLLDDGLITAQQFEVS